MLGLSLCVVVGVAFCFAFINILLMCDKLPCSGHYAVSDSCACDSIFIWLLITVICLLVLKVKIKQ